MSTQYLIEMDGEWRIAIWADGKDCGPGVEPGPCWVEYTTGAYLGKRGAETKRQQLPAATPPGAVMGGWPNPSLHRISGIRAEGLAGHGTYITLVFEQDNYMGSPPRLDLFCETPELATAIKAAIDAIPDLRVGLDPLPPQEPLSAEDTKVLEDYLATARNPRLPTSITDVTGEEPL